LRLRAFTLLAQNRLSHSDPDEVDKNIGELAAELQLLTSGIQRRLAEFSYPFSHARGRLTVAEYARWEKPCDHEWQRVYLDSEAHVDRLFALHYRLVGAVLARVDAAETVTKVPISKLQAPKNSQFSSSKTRGA
jgi:hypothetical protein